MWSLTRETWGGLVAQSFPTLYGPMDYSLPGSSVRGISQAKILEWVAISFSRGSCWPRDRTQVSRIVGGLLHCRQTLYWLNHQEAQVTLGPGLSVKALDYTHCPCSPSDEALSRCFICLNQGLLSRVALKGTKTGFGTFHFDGIAVKNPPANAGDPRDAGLILGSGRSPELGNGNSHQYSCLENPMDRRAWQAAIHGVAKNQMWLSMQSPLCSSSFRHGLAYQWWDNCMGKRIFILTCD